MLKNHSKELEQIIQTWLTYKKCEQKNERYYFLNHIMRNNPSGGFIRAKK